MGSHVVFRIRLNVRNLRMVSQMLLSNGKWIAIFILLVKDDAHPGKLNMEHKNGGLEDYFPPQLGEF